MSAFYITLQSNSSRNYFPNNLIGDFKNKLGSNISLPGGLWEVALTELSYTYGNAIIKKGEDIFTTRLDTPNKQGSFIYSTKTNENLITEFEIIDWLHHNFENSEFKIEFNSFKYKIPVKQGQSIQFSKKIIDIFGLGEDLEDDLEINEDNTRAYAGQGIYPVFVNAGNTKLFVYCNIVRPQFVGDVMIPCLRVVNYTGSFRHQQGHEFINPQYMDLAISEFDTIHMYILNEVGEVMPFEFGNLTATLRFREKKI